MSKLSGANLIFQARAWRLGSRLTLTLTSPKLQFKRRPISLVSAIAWKSFYDDRQDEGDRLRKRFRQLRVLYRPNR